MDHCMSSLPTVAVLGTGIMGAPMARNLLAAGFPVRAWNRSREKAAPLAGAGAVVAGSPAEAADGAQIVLTMLADADAVLDSVDAALDGPDVWVQASTIGIEGTERCAALAADRGVAFVDAPVLGTKQPAEAGRLTVLASGPAAERERLAPLFDAVGARTIWVGDAGAGTRLKLVANSWVLTLVEGLAETIALAEGVGVAPESFLEAIAGGLMDCGYAQQKGKAMIERSFEPAFPLRLAAKDVRLIEDAARRHELDLPLHAAIAARFAEGVGRGNGDLDMAATFLTGAPG
jgi:3-hydroxyisobutyrate dehydrogenase